MTAAILCPGPSLSEIKETPKADLTIGINRAMLAFDCHVWAATDYPMVLENHSKIKGSPILLTRKETWASLKGRCKLTLDTVEDIPALDMPKRWNLKTLTCAMAFAFSRGTKRIELYGCDWRGTADYDGKEAGENRSDERWEQERADVMALSRWLGKRGVEVIRR